MSHDASNKACPQHHQPQKDGFTRPSFTLRPTDTSQETIRSLPDLVHFNAVYNPDHVFAYQSRKDGKSFSYERFTFKEFAAAVGNCCEWILENIPKGDASNIDSNGKTEKAAPIALFMESGISLFTHICALLTLDIPCVLLSTRLSPAAIQNILEKTSTRSIIASSRLLANVTHSVPKDAASVVQASSISKDISSLKKHIRRLDSSSAHVREDDIHVVMLHSSGTTGLPKPIWLSQRYLLGYAACHKFPIDSDESKRGVNLSTLPIFHGFGCLAPSLSLSVGKPVCFLPTSTIPNAALVSQILQDRPFTSLMTVPTIMEELMSLEDNESAVKSLQMLDFVAVGGGGMKENVATWFADREVPLLNHFGATELGALAPIFRPDSDYDHKYLRFRQDIGLKLEFEDGQEGKEKSKQPRVCRLIGRQFGSEKEYILPDALECNPLNPTTEVRIMGRKDDVIVLASGEKVLGTLIEQQIEKCDSVKRALLLGQGYFEVGLFIEPADSLMSDDEIIDHVWPFIKEANAIADGHAQIHRREAILVNRTGQSLPLTDKGSVQRGQFNKKFEKEIAELFVRLDSTSSGTNPIDPAASNLSQMIKEVVQSCLPEYQNSRDLGDNDDLIQLGMDSLQISRLRQLLNSGFVKHNPKFKHLAKNFIYSYPSVGEMVQGLTARGNSEEPMNRVSDMQNLLSQLTARSNPNKLSQTVDEGAVILLTGSTGSLGSHLVQSLSQLSSVREIICLLRTRQDADQDLDSRQHKALQSRGIEISVAAWDKVRCIGWDTARDKFGVDAETYKDLVNNVTHIFYGAWPLDFQWKLKNFEPNFSHIQQTFDLGKAIRMERPQVIPRIVFASSIAVVGYCQDSTVPETMVDPAATVPMGYSEAKWICERLFENAATVYNGLFEPVVVRIGQLTGSQQTGRWNVKEHMPVLVRCGQQLGVLPDLQGHISWLPVDQGASAISDIILQAIQTPDLVYHVENPVRQSWTDVLTVIERALKITQPRMPFEEWLDLAISKDVIEPNLIPFFKDHFQRLSAGTVVLETNNSRRVSRSLSQQGSVSVKEIENYLNFWRSQGLIVTR